MEFLTKTSMKAEPQLPENIECKVRVTNIHYILEIECMEFMYLNCGIHYEDMIDHCSYARS